MLTILTQEAIRVLRYIYYRDAGISCPPDSSDCAFRNVSVLLPLLERGGLIRCICPESPDSPVSYELCKPLGSIDLLDPARGGVSGFSGCRRAACLWPLWVGGLPYGGCQPDDAQHIQRNPFDRTLFVNRFLEIAAMNRILLLLGYILLLSAPVSAVGVSAHVRFRTAIRCTRSVLYRGVTFCMPTIKATITS